MRIDLDIINHWIGNQSRILDLACGDGTLLRQFMDSHNVLGYGLEIDEQAINTCISNGVNVIQADLNEGLARFDDQSFDTVLMTNSLQAMRYPHILLDDMLRVGREAIVTFPNFGHWKVRAYLSFKGKMPVTKKLHYQWYDTPNIHFFTVADFEQFCTARGITILTREYLNDGDNKLSHLWPNLFTTTAIYRLTRN